MKISEVRIKLMDNADDRLRAFCSITLDDAFVVRDLKIIDGKQRPIRRHAQSEIDGSLSAVWMQKSLESGAL